MLFVGLKHIQTMVPCPTDVFLTKSDGFENSGLPQERGAAWWMPGLGLGSYGLPISALGGMCIHPTFFFISIHRLSHVLNRSLLCFTAFDCI